MATYSAAEALLIVVVNGSQVVLDERYRRMILWVVKLQRRLDGYRAGKLHLHFNGNSVAAAVEEAFGPEWLEKAG